MLLRVLQLAFKALIWIAVLSIPALGVWLSSSLAAYAHGPYWLVCLAGTMLFPILPLAWELRAKRRAARKRSPSATATLSTKTERPRLLQLSFWDRFVLRTLCINLVFLVPLLYFFPKPSFRALATRGDWFLQYARPTLAGTLRPYLFSSVDSLAWIHRMATDNPYERYQDQSQDPEPPPPVKAQPQEPKGDPAPTNAQEQRWPLPVGLHPVVTSMPAQVQSDYPSVARYIGERIETPRERIKALHDFVIWHLDYDYPALESRDIPDQHSASVFATRKAVCAGYARLLSDMGKELGLDIRYITGQVRENGQLADIGHAWNAAKIDGSWELIDATWNDQDHREHPDRNVNEGYRTTYLFAPPQAFLLEHFPKDPRWQRIPEPMHLQEFLRQAPLEPEFLAAELSLVNPNLRAQVQTDESRWTLSVSNPKGHALFANVTAKDPSSGSDAASEPCRIFNGEVVKIDCPLAWDTSIVELYGGTPNPDKSYPRLGQIEVHYR